TAVGNNLFKCIDFNFTTQLCSDLDNYTLLRTDLIPGQTYTFVLTPTDPGFGETITAPENISDSRIRSATPNTNFGLNGFIRAGRKTADNIHRGIIRFNISSLPTGIRVDNAALRLFFFSIPGGDNVGLRTFGVHRIQQNPPRDWIETQVTWNEYTTGNVWTSPGGDFNSVSTFNVTFGSAALNTFIEWNVTSDVELFNQNRSANFGWVIKDELEDTNDFRRDFRSSEATQLNEIPQLIINYTDIQPPTLFNIKEAPPSPVTYLQGRQYQFNISLTDNIQVGTVLLQHNFTGTTINQTVNNISNEYFFNISDIGAGTYAYTWFANDSSNNFNSTPQQIYVIGKANSSIELFLNGSTADFIAEALSPVNATANLTFPYSGAVQLLQNGTLMQQGESPLTNISIRTQLGVFNVTALFQETSNFTSSFRNRTLTVVDTKPPFRVELVSPGNLFNTSNENVTFVFNATDEFAVNLSCNLLVNGTVNQTNGSVINNLQTSMVSIFDDGFYSWQVNCSDQSANSNVSGTRFFAVDLTAPNLTIDFPPAVSFFKTDFNVNVTINDNFMVSLVQGRFENGSINSSFFNLTQEADPSKFSTIVPIDFVNDGKYTLRIFATDFVSNTNATETVGNITIDNTIPTITGFTLSSTSVTVGTPITGSCSATDNIDTNPTIDISGIDTSSAGSKIATCTVTDDSGNVATATVGYTVTSADAPPPGPAPAPAPAPPPPPPPPAPAISVSIGGKAFNLTKERPLEAAAGEETEKLTIDLAFRNPFNETLRDVLIALEKPEFFSNAAPIHLNKVVGYDQLGLIGWTIESNLEEMKLLEWDIQPPPQKIAQLSPDEIINTKFTVRAPLGGEDYDELTFKVQVGNKSLIEQKIPIKINKGQFTVIPKASIEKDEVEIYMLITNLREKNETFYVEFNMDIEEDEDYQYNKYLSGMFAAIFKGRRTAATELFGPYKIKKGDTIILAHRYKYLPSFRENYIMNAVLYDNKGNKIDRAIASINLKTEYEATIEKMERELEERDKSDMITGLSTAENSAKNSKLLFFVSFFAIILLFVIKRKKLTIEEDAQIVQEQKNNIFKAQDEDEEDAV
ncbi:MAG: DNRLRE domain-containing protein, partial [Candidatus Woesearchaeota archaeon]